VLHHNTSSTGEKRMVTVITSRVPVLGEGALGATPVLTTS